MYTLLGLHKILKAKQNRDKAKIVLEKKVCRLASIIFLPIVFFVQEKGCTFGWLSFSWYDPGLAKSLLLCLNYVYFPIFYKTAPSLQLKNLSVLDNSCDNYLFVVLLVYSF